MTKSPDRDNVIRFLVLTIAVAVVAAVCACNFAATDDTYADDSGDCGDDLTWVFAGKDKTLTISGTGEMFDYGGSCPSWDRHSGVIEKIVLSEGTASIGSHAFRSFCRLTSVTMPGTVTAIGEGAFDGCCSLTSVNIADAVTVIGDYAFDGCCSLSSVDMPSSLEKIGDYVFCGCRSLTSVSIPGLVSYMGSYAFGGCPVLTVYNYSSLDVAKGQYGLRDDANVIVMVDPHAITSGGFGSGFFVQPFV